jgi:hypothetical protein
MTTAWREFEKLIARIEQAMAPSGAEIKSPDRIPDRVTGELREVDASIRYKVGTCPILITVECRDRSGNRRRAVDRATSGEETQHRSGDDSRSILVRVH